MWPKLIAAFILTALICVCVCGCHARVTAHAGPPLHGLAAERKAADLRFLGSSH